MKKFIQEVLWPSSQSPSSPKPGGLAEECTSQRIFGLDCSKNPTPSNTDPYQPEEFMHPPPPSGHHLPNLPPEIHFQILEYSDWREHPNLSRVCKLWRHFLKKSPSIIASHYENYNITYEEVWQSSSFRNRPRPNLHKIVDHLEIFVRGRNGSSRFRPGRIELKTPRDRWGGYSEFGKSAGNWIEPKCKLLEPFDYSLFKDEPIVRYSEGKGGNVNIRAVDPVEYYGGRPFRFEPFRFEPTMTVGDYIRELCRLVNDSQRYMNDPWGGSDERSANNVVWVSVRATLTAAVDLHFAYRAVRYEIEF